MNSNAFAKGDALAKLIELIGADNKAFKAQDAELLASINEVRDMFNTDELTVCSWAELVELAQAGNLEPGHKYKINHNVAGGGKNLVNLTVSAKSNSELETIAVADGYLVHIQNGANFGAFKYEIDIVNDGTNVTVAGKRAMPYMDTTGEILLEKFQTGTYWGKYPAEEMALTGYFDIIFPDKTAKFIWFPNSGSTGYAFGLTDVTISIHDIIAFDDLVNALTTINNLGELDVNEFTTCTLEEFYDLRESGNVKAGHKYCITSAIPSADVAQTVYTTFTNIVIIGAPGSKCFGLALANTGIAIVDGWNERDAKVKYFATVEMLARVVTAYGHNNTVDTLTNVPVNTATVVANISTDQTLSWASNLWRGLEVICLIKNTGTEDITIILPDNSNEDVLLIPAGEHAEVSVVNIGGTYYTRVPSTTGGTGTDGFFGTSRQKSAVVPVDKSTIWLDFDGDKALQWEEGLPAGREVLAIINNTTDDEITVTLPENSNVPSIKIKAREYSEVSVVNVDDQYITRASVDEVISSGGGNTSDPVEYDEITAADIQAMFNGTYGN